MTARSAHRVKARPNDWTTSTYSVFMASVHMRPRIAVCCCTISAPFLSSSVAAYLREGCGCNPAAFAAERSSWGAYLALGYRLTRVREKIELAGSASPAEPA